MTNIDKRERKEKRREEGREREREGERFFVYIYIYIHIFFLNVNFDKFTVILHFLIFIAFGKFQNISRPTIIM